MWADFKTLLNQGWVGVVIGTVLSLLGIGIGYDLYRRSKRKGRLAAEWLDFPVLGYRHTNALSPAVSIQYEGEPVPRVGLTDVLIWNAGSDTLSGTHIVAADPVRIELSPDSELLEFGLVYTTREASQWGLQHDPIRPNALLVSFDYLEPGDGARLRVMHTAVDLGATVCGSMRGMPEGVLDLGYLNALRAGWHLQLNEVLQEAHRGRRVARVVSVVSYLGVLVFASVLTTGIFVWALADAAPFGFSVLFGLGAAACWWVAVRRLYQLFGPHGPPALLYGVPPQR